MRVLVTTVGLVGHIFPLVSIAHALRAAGHEVLWATPQPELVAKAGLSAFDPAPGVNPMEIIQTVLAKYGLGFEISRDEYAKEVEMGGELLARLGEVTIDRTVAVARNWRPDLVLYDELQPAGPLVASMFGVPAVEQILSVCGYREIRDGMRQHLDEAYDRHGVVGAPSKSVLLDTRPPSMRQQDFDGWSMRLVPYSGSSVLPDWLLEPPARPRVAVTLGTTTPGFMDLGAFRNVIDAAAQVDAEFVLATGDADISGFGALPGNVRAAGWVPLHALLQTCSSMIHHVGGGTSLTGLSTGVTHLTMPISADSWQVSEQIIKRGLGVEAGAPEEVTADMIRTVLFDPSMRAAADEVKAEIAAMPSPASMVSRLEGLTA
ncbi:nucleotide disphospho-sugar-binding domain-containing protein [Lentzea sp. NPDC051838]|uniref:nucleotide disphospho-sugar-binding domain-containing protein n=1 Tax=Lentzea sp. NPDC051838 TaxID=3154849 RepID=UPI00342EB263